LRLTWSVSAICRVVADQHGRVALENAAGPAHFGDARRQILEGVHQAAGLDVHRVEPARQVARQRDALLDQADREQIENRELRKR
jgi:hypothetical protein